VAQQGPHPPRSGRLSAPGSGPSWDDASDLGGEDLPPWAGLAVQPQWAGGRRHGPAPRRPAAGQRPASPEEAWETGGWEPGPDEPPPGAAKARPRPRGRQAAARARRTRRSIYRWGGLLVLAAAAGLGTWLLVGGHSSPGRVPDAIVTNFLPGEFHTVPNVCTAVTARTLGQYLPGKRTVASPSTLNGGSGSLCSWTLDAKPTYRLLNVQAQAYAPNGLASGDGSATFAAIDGYGQALRQKTRPPGATHLPRATITAIPGLGSKAFAAYQQATSASLTTDLVTVVVRDRNVLVTAVLQGDASPQGYGPVPVAQLRAGAIAAARDVLAQLK
jgi:hypothetical protein